MFTITFFFRTFEKVKWSEKAPVFQYNCCEDIPTSPSSKVIVAMFLYKLESTSQLRFAPPFITKSTGSM